MFDYVRTKDGYVAVPWKQITRRAYPTILSRHQNGAPQPVARTQWERAQVWRTAQLAWIDSLWQPVRQAFLASLDAETAWRWANNPIGKCLGCAKRTDHRYEWCGWRCYRTAINGWER